MDSAPSLTRRQRQRGGGLVGGPRDLLHRLLGEHVEEAVVDALVPLKPNRDAGRLKGGGVRFSLVAQRIEFRSDDHGWWKPREVLGIDRTGVGITAIRRLRYIAVPEPLHRISGQEVALGVLPIGRALEVRVSHWIDQQLEPKCLALPRHAEGNAGGEVAAGAVAPDGDTVGIDP